MGNDNRNLLMLRKYQNNLVVSGMAVIVFSVWSLLKFALAYFMSKEGYLDEKAFGGSEGILSNQPVIIIMISTIIIALIVGLNVYIGLCARSVGTGKKNRVFFIIPAFCLLIIYSAAVIFECLPSNFENGVYVTTIVTILVDITNLFAYVDLIYSFIRIKVLQKSLKKEEEV